MTKSEEIIYHVLIAVEKEFKQLPFLKEFNKHNLFFQVILIESIGKKGLSLNSFRLCR